jgi:hypothetical protein
MTKQLSKSAKLSFFKARRRAGEVSTLAESTGYSSSHISNVLAGRRSAPQLLADEMYSISRKRSTTKA